MARITNRWELEESRKKKAQEAALAAAKSALNENPAQTFNRVQGMINSELKKQSSTRSSGGFSGGSGKSSGRSSGRSTTKVTSGRSYSSSRRTSSRSSSSRSSSAADTRPAGSRIPEFLQGPRTAQPKVQPLLTSANPLSNINTMLNSAITSRKSGGFGGGSTGTALPRAAGTTRSERADDLKRLMNNSVSWHFANDKNKQRLFEENNAIRQKYGLQYNNGDTFLPNGVNLSEANNLMGRVGDYKNQNVLTTLGHNIGASVAGINEGFYNTVDAILPDVITPAALQDYIDKAKSDAKSIHERVDSYNYDVGGKVGGVAGDLFQGAVGMIPQAVVTLLSGGLSTAGQLGTKATTMLGTVLNAIRNNAGYLASFLSTVGTDYENAKANGATDMQAALSAIASSAMTAGIEVSGGFDVPTQSTSRIRNAIRTAFEEGGEEVLQGTAQRLTQALYDPEMTVSDILDMGQMLQDFGGGAILGSIAGGLRKPAQTNTDTPLSGINEDIDVRNSWAHENNTLPSGEVPLLQEGTVEVQSEPLYAGREGVSTGRGNINNAPDVGTLYGGASGVAYRNLPDVLYASQSGQVASGLPTGYLPEGRNTQTRIAQQVDRTVTYPRLQAIDDAGNTNGGMTDNEMQFAQQLFSAQQRSGVTANEIANEIVSPVMQQYREIVTGTEQYMRDYKGQGTVVVGTDDYGRDGYRASQNESWYSDFYAENGRAPRKSEIPALAQTTVDNEIARGGGQFVTAQFAENYKQALEVQEAANRLGNNALDVQPTAEGIQVTYGTPARTADIRETNAGRNVVNPVTQGAPQAPINIAPITRQFQNNVPASGTAVNVRTVIPNGSPAASPAFQADPTSVNAQPMVQPTLQTARPMQQTAQPRVQPTLQTAAQASMVAQRAASPESSVGAAQSNFDPYTHMANEYGTIKPGENPARIVDVPKSTDGTDRVSASARTFMEAGVTTDEVVGLLQDEVAKGNFSHEVITDEGSLKRAANRLANTADPALAADEWTAFADGSISPSKDDIAYGDALYAYFNKIGDNENAVKMASSLIAQASRAGQTLQAFKLLKKTSPEGRVMSAVKIRDNIQKQANDRYGDKAPQITIDDSVLNDLRNADVKDVDKQMDKVVEHIANQLPNTWWDKWDAWRYTSMLGNIRTHLRNIFGNTMFRPAIKAKDTIGAVLETAADTTRRLRGKEPMERTKSITTRKADRDFAKSEFDKLSYDLGGSRYDANDYDSIQRAKTNPFSGGLLERIGIGRFNLASGLNKLSQGNSNLLEWEDMIAKKSVYVDSMAQYMKANKLTAKDMYNELGGETDALLSAREYAKNEALKATFQDENTLANALSYIEKKLGRPGRLIVGGLFPFKRTPPNIIKRGIEYSPIGAANGVRKFFSKNYTTSEAFDSLAAGITGSMVMALGYFMAEQGWLSAGDDPNDKKQYFDEMQGDQSYAVNFSWDGKEYSYTIDWSAPMALPLFVGAELFNFINRDDNVSFEDFTESLSRIAEPVFDLTMMQGINDAIDSAKYGGGAAVAAMATSSLTDYITQGVPTLLGQINRSFFDKTRRQTYPDQDNNIPDGLEKVMQRTMQKIPGLSQYITPYLDNFGRTQENGGAIENFLSPGYLEERNSTDAERAINALYEATGETSILPSRPQKYYKDGDVQHNLTANQWLRLTNIEGQTSLDEINALVNSSAYQSMSNTEKINAINDIYSYASAVAANQVYNKELEGTIKTVHDSGIDPGLYYAYKEMEDTLNETLEGYEARDQVFQTIRGDNSLTDDQKNQLYHTLLIKGTSDSQWEKYKEISDTVTAEEYVDAMIQSQAIKAYGDELEEGRATAEATEFSYYLDQMGYSDEKRAALENTFKFYNMFPAEPSNYSFDMMRENGSNAEKENASAIEASGVTAAQYMTIKNLTKDATYTKGETGAKLAAYGKIVSENTDNYDQYAAIMHAMGYKNIDDAYTGAGALPEAEEATSQVSRSASTTDPAQETGINPVAAGPGVSLGDVYGWRDPPAEGASSFHQGNDIPAPMGTPVVAYKSGTVSYVGDGGSGGNMVQIDHPDGTQSVYLHLQNGSFKVSPGQTVSQGQQIANVGSTGVSTGPHLDFRIKVNGEYVDPRSYYPGY